MNIQLKQRLTGAVVLVALAVIFIPILLPGEGNLGGKIEGSNIPAEPDFRFPPVPASPRVPPVAARLAVPLGDGVEPETAPDKPAPAKEIVSQPSVNMVEKAQALPPVKPAPSVVEKIIPAENKPAKPGQVSGWVVQVGSFSARNNAQALRDKLRKQGHTSFVESVKGTSGRVYRVRVGPELSKSAADKLRQRLLKEAGLKGLVQVYP